MHLQHLLTVAILSAPSLLAQVPTDHLVVVDSFSPGPFVATSYTLHDLSGGGRTSVVVPTTFGAPPPAGVAIDPASATSLWFLEGPGATAGINRVDLGLLAGVTGPIINQPWTNTGGERLRIAGGQVFTLRAGGFVERTPVAGGSPTLVVQHPNASDIAVEGGFLYVSARDAAAPQTPQPLIEVTLATGAQRIIGSYADVRRIAVAPLGTRCALGNGSAVVEIDPGTGSTIGTVPVSSPVQAVGYSSSGLLAYGTGTGFGYELWVIGRPAPIFSDPLAGLIDFDISVATAATFVEYGAGCNNGGQVNWTVNSAPTVGNATFAFGIGQAPPNTPAAVFVGIDRSFSTVQGAPLPFDLTAAGAPGCLLLCDPIVGLVLAVDSAGGAQRPTPLPSSPLLVGVEWSGQAFIYDAAITPQPWSGTRGFAMRMY